MSAFQGFRQTKYFHTYSLFKVSSHWGCNEIHLLITSIQSCLWHQLPRVLVGSLGSSAVPTHHRQGSWTRRDQNCRVTSNKHILTSPKKHLLLPGKSIFNAYCGAGAAVHMYIHVHLYESVRLDSTPNDAAYSLRVFAASWTFYCHYGLPKFFAPVPIRSFLKSSELKELISNIEKDIIFQLLSNFLLVSYVSVP